VVRWQKQFSMNLYNGESIRKLRTLKSVKQTTIAKKIGMSQQAYSLLEKKSEIPVPTFTKIIKCLDSNMEEYLKVTNSPRKKN
jgi:transcriptional regulator with XRE-family HTH domain